jgi:Cu(I)/Ag(I) efflux system membrane fusion protein
MRWAALGALVVLAVAAGVLLEQAFDLVGGRTAGDGGPDSSGTQSRYICPMHPEIVREGPDSCPICGMDLVLADPAGSEETTEGESPVVWIEPEIEHNLGVRTAPASFRLLQRQIDTVGYVEYDRSRLRDIYGPADGYINGLTLYSEGERVKKGQFLFNLDSPTLSTYYDDTYADQDGIVAYLNVIEGEFVTSTTKVLTLADLSGVWVLADVFERHAHWVGRGQSAIVRLPYVSDRTWQGKVEYIYPNLDPETRTLKVRMRFDNPDETLKPNMHAEVSILAGEGREVLAIPREAVIETGIERRVVVAQGNGHFQPRTVDVGMEHGDWVEIVDGLTEGEEVVVSGQFLLDSESNLKASLARLASDR